MGEQLLKEQTEFALTIPRNLRKSEACIDIIEKVLGKYRQAVLYFNTENRARKCGEFILKKRPFKFQFKLMRNKEKGFVLLVRYNDKGRYA